MKYLSVILGFWIGLGFGANPFYPQLPKSNNTFNQDAQKFTHLLGLMVEFQYEEIDDPTTSGRGHFLDSVDITFADTTINSDSTRCDGFLVDRPPHNIAYFNSQLTAVKNYYETVSQGNVAFNIMMIDEVFQLPNSMESYAHSDTALGRLFTETMHLATETIENELTNDEINIHDVLFVVFHAGLGQDFTVPFIDPTSYDLRSAFIDDAMLVDAPTININGLNITRGILLPETQNMIYFDVIEDIYPGENYCNYQFGLTGTFTFLLGYALGLPPMFDTETGNTGIGQFGLMDVGSGNGQGVIPAPPTAWTRSKHQNFGWIETINITQDILLRDTTLYIPKRINEDVIYRIDISDDEYFLIENRNNNVFDGIDIDSLRWKYKIDDYIKGNYFDIIEMLSRPPTDQNNLEKRNIAHQISLEIDPLTKVITRIYNYDLGLPGSGLLIWHIKEPVYPFDGINNDIYARAVQLEEADGAIDIGYDSYAFFASSDPTQGTLWDFWYSGNEGYEYSNPNNDFVVFDSNSHPNSNTIEGINSNIKIKILSPIQDIMTVQISIENQQPITNLPEGSSIIGSADSTVYYSMNNLVYQATQDVNDLQLDLVYDSDNIILTFEDSIYYTTLDSIVDTSGTLIPKNNVFPMGNIEFVDSITVSENADALGDIDGDGLDEMITVNDGVLSVENVNGTSCNGFPIPDDFYGIPLVANIVEVSDNSPEIICRNGDHITILDNRGKVLQELTSIDYEADLLMVPFWENDSSVLVDGNRLIQFPFDSTYSYWMGPHSRSSHYPQSTGAHEPTDVYDEGTFSKIYNYPNPITEGRTTFRFFTPDAQTVIIKIYNVAGFNVDELFLDTLTPNEFNEIPWDASQFDSGLYFAEVKPDIGESSLIRLVIVK